MLDHSCWTHCLGEVGRCSTGCTVCWCPHLCSIPNLASSGVSFHRKLFELCHSCHLSSYSCWLCSLIWTWNSTLLSSPSHASCGLIDHNVFFTDSTKRPPMLLCLFTAKRAPSGIHLGTTWRSLLMTLLTSAICCVVCSPIALPNSVCVCVTTLNLVWFRDDWFMIVFIT